MPIIREPTYPVQHKRELIRFDGPPYNKSYASQEAQSYRNARQRRLNLQVHAYSY